MKQTTTRQSRQRGFTLIEVLIAIAIIVVHIYAGIWVRGTGRAMVRGTVTGGWSWRHHRKWLRELARRQTSKPAE